jgi:mono/diheme cytochrome c family protein
MFLASASLIAILPTGCDSLPGRPTQADLPLRPTNVTDFATLYGENCAGCHGADGKSGAAIAINNPVYLAIIDDASMCRAIAEGVGPPAGSVVDASYLALVSNQYLRKIVIAGRPDLGHPNWKNDLAGQPLTPEQVSDLLAWLASKRPAPLARSN